jgi:hypothetical protein
MCRAVSTSAEGLNDLDQIVGVYSQFGDELSFMRDGNTYCAVQVPNSTETQAQDINDSGVITGFYSGSGGIHGFLAKPVGP